MDLQQITTHETLGIRDITLPTDVITEFVSIVSDQTSQPTKDSYHGAIGDINAERGTTIPSSTKSESSLETDMDSEFQVTAMSFSADNARINTERSTTEKQDELRTRTGTALTTEILTAFSTQIPLSSRSDDLSFVDNNVTNEESDEKMTVSSELTTEPRPQWSSSTPIGSMQETTDIVTGIARPTQSQEVVSTEIDIQQRTADDTLGIQDITLPTEVVTESVSIVSDQTSQPTKDSVYGAIGDINAERGTTLPSNTKSESSLETDWDSEFQATTMSSSDDNERINTERATTEKQDALRPRTGTALTTEIFTALSTQIPLSSRSDDLSFGVNNVTNEESDEKMTVSSELTTEPRPQWSSSTPIGSMQETTDIVTGIARPTQIQEVVSTEIDIQQRTADDILGIQDITLPTEVVTESVSIVSDQTSQPTKDSVYGSIGDITTERGKTIPSNSKSESSLETDWDSEFQVTTMSFSVDNARINTERATTEKQDALRTRTDMTLATEIFTAVSTQIPLSSRSDDLSFVDNNVTNEESDEKMTVSSELTTEPRPQWSSSTPIGSMQETTDIVTGIARPTQSQEVVSTEIDIQQRTADDTLGIQDITLPTEVVTESVSIVSDQTSQPTKDSPVDGNVGDNIGERWTTIPSKTESEVSLETEFNAGFQTYTVTEVHSQTPPSTSLTTIVTDIARSSHIQEVLSTEMDSQQITTDEVLGIRDITLPTDVVTEIVNIVSDQTSQPTKDSVHGTIGDDIAESGTTRPSKRESESGLVYVLYTKFQEYTVTDVHSRTPPSTSPTTIVTDIARSSHIQEVLSTEIDSQQITTHEKLGIQDITLPTDVDTEFVSIVSDQTSQPTKYSFHGAIGDINAERGTTIPSNTKSESSLETDWDSEIQATTMSSSEDNARINTERSTTEKQDELRTRTDTTLGTKIFTAVSTQIPLSSTLDDLSNVDDNVTNEESDEKLAVSSELTTEPRPQWSSSTPIGSMQETTDIVTGIARPTQIQEVVSTEIDIQQRTADDILGIQDITLPTEVVTESVSIVSDQTSQPTKDSVHATIGDDIAERGTTIPSKTESESSLETELNTEFQTYTVTEVQSPTPSSTSPKIIVTDIARPSHIQYLLSTEMDSQRITTHETLGIRDITLPTDVVTEFVSIVLDQTSQPTKDSVHGTIRDNIRERGTTIQSKIESELSLGTDWDTEYQTYTVTEVLSPTPSSTSPPTKIMSTAIDGDLRSTDQSQDLISSYLGTEQATEMLTSEDNVRDKAQQVTTVQQTTLRSGRRTTLATENFTGVSTHILMTSRTDDSSSVDIKMTDVEFDEKTAFISELPTEVRPEWSSSTPIGSMRRTTDIVTEIKRPTHIQEFISSEMDSQQITTDKPLGIKDITLPTDVAIEFVSIVLDQTSQPTKYSPVDGTIGDNIADRGTTTQTKTDSEISLGTEWDIEFETYTVTDVQSSKPSSTSPKTIVTDIARPTHIQELVSAEMDSQQITTDEALGIQDITDSISTTIDGDPKSTDQSSDMKSSFLGTETPLTMPTTEGKPGTKPKTEGVLTEIPDTPTLEGDGDLTTEIISGISTQSIMTSKSDDLNLWDTTTPLLSKSSTNTGTDLPTFSFEAIVTEKSDIVSDSLEITETEKGISQEMDFESAATDKPFQMTDATYSTLSVTHDVASILERTVGHTKKQHSKHTFPIGTPTDRSVTEDEWYTETITYSLEGKESSRGHGPNTSSNRDTHNCCIY
ncbi:mucin-17-like [Lytechinus variegatus]|uniref:mucin-17-like n=1 Tax=Lytechinus variegatus TaxID=7654 RepID=UPI001BB2685A|nr:mucin-17-like [Lytechinus variegatus]